MMLVRSCLARQKVPDPPQVSGVNPRHRVLAIHICKNKTLVHVGAYPKDLAGQGPVRLEEPNKDFTSGA